MNEKIKVLAIVCQLNNGGLENRLMDIIRNIDYSRIQIDVYTYSLNKGVFDDEVKKYGGVVYYNKPLTVRNMISYPRYFRDFLLEHPEYKIIHAHQDAWCSIFCKGAYLAGVPVRIAHSRTALTLSSVSNIAKNTIKLLTNKYATHYFAVSFLAAKWLFGKKKVEKGLVRIWPNAIESEKYSFNTVIRNEVRTANNWINSTVIMHVGNFTPPKNHPFLIDIFSETVKLMDNAILVLVGSGDVTKTKERCKKYGLNDKVVFLGNRNDVAQLLQAADVFVFPSLYEGLPGAVIEGKQLDCLVLYLHL